MDFFNPGRFILPRSAPEELMEDTQERASYFRRCPSRKPGPL